MSSTTARTFRRYVVCREADGEAIPLTGELPLADAWEAHDRLREPGNPLPRTPAGEALCIVVVVKREAGAIGQLPLLP